MFQIDRYGRQPIYEQIIEQVEQLVASGVLRPDDQLPSVRALSQSLSANPNTLQKAYSELERRGVTTGVPGSGRYISRDAPRIVAESMVVLLAEITAISAKLRLAGVPSRRVMDAVAASYAEHATPAPEARETDVSQSSSNGDAPQGATGKDVKL